MKAALLVCLALVSLATSAFAAPRFMLAAGPTPTGKFGFEGGWGITAGAEMTVTPQASVLVRFDQHDLPDPLPFLTAWAVGVVGDGPSDRRAGLLSGMAGVRLHSPGRRADAYVDALVGVGHVNVQERFGFSGAGDRTGLALSFGSGISIGASGRGRVFGDAHLDWYLVEDMDSPLIPLRLGLQYP